MHIDIALLGFGNVARALARLLVRKTGTLQSDYGLTYRVTGIATRSRGCAIDPDGLDLEAALRLVEGGQSLESLHKGAPVADTLAFIAACPADLVMEATWLNPQTGQPATDYVRAALAAGRHVVTANKGPVAFAYRELMELARQQDRGFFFESTVMDGAPVLGMGREAFLATTIERVRGILNSTTNYILTRLEQGVAFADAVAEAQRIGGAEDARAHAVNIADDAADARGSALNRQDLRRVVVALMRHHDAPAATVVLGEEDDAGVLLRAEDHVRRVGRQELQRGLRGLVGAVLAPLHVEDMQLNEGRVAADKLRYPPGLADRQPYTMLVESGLKLFIVHLRHCYLSFVEFHQGSPLHQRVPK